MSVILDALHKARGDRRGPDNAKSVAHEQAVARVVDAGLAPAGAVAIAKPRSERGGRGWIVAAAVMFGGMCLIVLIGGAFFLLYDQMRRIESAASNAPLSAQTSERALASAAQPSQVIAGVDPAGNVTPAPVVLPTPVPLSELPVQVPGVAGGTVATAGKEDFTLGSIVCENNDCIASLNGRSVRVGDTVKGHTVVAIDSTVITLKNGNGAELRLSLFD